VSGSGRALLIDFGSTFTKVRAVDMESGALLGSAQAPSTVGTTMMDGLRDALDPLARQLGDDRFDDDLKLASSSAAGGLRIVAVGLMKQLTAEAARRAALGAGGKVIATFANGLTSSDVTEIKALDPDVLVLAGGTDGGNRECIVGNATAIAAAGLGCPILVAGNRNAADEVSAILAAGGCDFEVVPNVLPEVNRLGVDGCAAAIRRTFMERIVTSKGLDEAQSFVGKILMPTPHAVLLGCQLLADGPSGDDGLGEIVAVDVGGATTDVYSVADGRPRGDRVAVRGLPEPLVKRTVEGDLGMRINASSVVAAVGVERFEAELGDGVDVAAAADDLTERTDQLPADAKSRRLDLALGGAAVRLALRRHAGTVDIAYGPNGPFSVQIGKDLRGVDVMVASGGVFAANPDDAMTMLHGALHDEREPEYLVPERPDCLVDRDYVLYAVGLLSAVAPGGAYELGRSSLRRAATTEAPTPA
jgi:uncharacterized protein (TIGR01319 family)